ncbi:hypothetical protein IKG33_00330 [Candidatus Saccharibacteria bacterium]|nr:hypothetical protein [Candidatus Saccharibacteria bacterium]
MKKNIVKVISLVVILGLVFFGINYNPGAYAEGEEESETSESSEAVKTGASISLMPVSKILQISSNSEYKDKITVANDGDNDMKIEVYAAPYSYVYSEEENVYKLGFNKENNFTQIVRWIKIKDSNGNYVDKPTFDIPPKESIDIEYKISTPDNIPAGGQYAVLFAHTLTATTTESGIRTEASPGMVIYGRSNEGDVILKAEVSDLNIIQGATESGGANKISASAKIKNEGNIDISATGVLRIDGILGGGHYETTSTGGGGRVSVIPETELAVSDTWEETPSFGIYKVTWTVTAGENSQTIEKVIFINPLPFILITIILLTIVIIWSIMRSRKRKERRSRLAI